MARKHVDLKAAKAAKQKKLAIGLGLLFVAMLIFTVPKTMKMMHPHHAVATAAASTSTTPTTTTPGAQTTAPTMPTSAPTSVPVSSTSGNAVLTARLAPAAHAGQLASLSASFRTKDPFKQLIDTSLPPAAPPAEQPASSAKPAAQPKPAASLKVVPNAPVAAKPSALTAPAAHKVALPFLSAVIAVNDTRGHVGVHTKFPSGAPMFHLLSLTKKTAKVSVVGGSLAGGAATLTLRLNKPVTLVNTADGTRYRLVLVSTSTKAAAAPAQPAAAPASTTPTSTTPTQTSTTPTDTLAVPPLGG